MFQIRNLSKAYLSKNGGTCEALKGIDFDLPSTGLTFVIGKSGCGKSTLLHLIGGLDKATSGDIIYKNKALSAFTDRDFDAYRNNLGFVFQDSHLIENMTVRENISLSLELKDKKSEEVITKVLGITGIPELIDRFPNELSGGQRQRVALARALVKDPEIILADEPTGNLDSKTSKIILDILKELSKDKLVIIVSHDKEYAEKHADRLIELSDGKVINDNQLNYKNINSYKQYLPKKSNLPNRYTIKLAFSNIRQKPIRLFISILLSVTIMVLIAITQAIHSYNKDEALARNLVNNEVEVIAFGLLNKPIISINDRTSFNYAPLYNANISSKLLETFNKDITGINYLRSYYINSNNVIIGDFSILNYVLCNNAAQLQNNTVYITDIHAYKIINEKILNPFMNEYGSPLIPKYYIKENDALIGLTESYDYYDLCNKTIYSNTGFEIIKVAGILITNELDLVLNYNDLTKIEKSIIDYKIQHFYYSYYVNQDYLNSHKTLNSPDFFLNENNNFNIKIDEKKIDYLAYCSMLGDDCTYILSSSKIYSDSKRNLELLELNEGEVIISIDLYNILFDTSYKSTDIYNGNTVLIDLEHVGEYIDLDLKDKSDNEILFLNGLKIIGVTVYSNYYQGGQFYYDYKSENINEIYISYEDYAKFYNSLPNYNNFIYLKTPKDPKDILNYINLAKTYNAFPIAPFVSETYSYEYNSGTLNYFVYINDYFFGLYNNNAF